MIKFCHKEGFYKIPMWSLYSMVVINWMFQDSKFKCLSMTMVVTMKKSCLS